jgi:hypothetical protein
VVGVKTLFIQILKRSNSQCVGSLKKKGTLPPMENKPNQENILNAILPPREWVENGKHYI